MIVFKVAMKKIIFIMLMAAAFMCAGVSAQETQEMSLLNQKDEVEISVIVAKPASTGFGMLPKTGQTISYMAGDDGDLEKGCPLDGAERWVIGTGATAGTITDNVTGLMWELKTSNTDVGIHGRRRMYTWFDAFDVFIKTLNDTKFAGYNDWRLPNIWELRSIVNYGGNLANPSQLTYSAYFPYTVWKETVSGGYVNPAYWVSTTNPGDSYYTFAFIFSTPTSGFMGKSTTVPVWPSNGVCVMAVRGGRK